MMKNIIRSLIFLFSIVVLNACYDDPGLDIVWDGESYLEIDEAGVPNSNTPLLLLKDPAGNTPPVPQVVTAQIMGLAQQNAVNVSFTLGGTAIEGVHYTIPGGSTSVTIQPGEYSADFTINFLPDALDLGDQVTLEVTITGGDLPLSEYVEVTYIVEVTCPPNIPTDVTWAGETTGGVFGEFGSNSGITISLRADQVTHDISDFSAGYFTAFGGSASYPGVFTNACNEITLLTSNTDFGSCETDPDNGAPLGSFDPGTNTLTIPWYNAFNDFAEVSVFQPE